MSKSPSSEPQFQSGLNQSFQGLALSGGGAGSPPASPASPARPKIMIEYKELKFGARKGKGAYGEVFEGQYHKEKVAIKVYDFRGQLSAQEQADIMQEAELMEGLRSQYLVGFRGICLDERYCLVMEYCDGGTLRGRLDKTEQAINPLDQLRWAQQISYGIYKLHSIRIIHRDLKGENVLLDRHGEAKVADFGLSVVKSSSSQSKQSGPSSVAGTMPWMAPELFSGQPNSPATDVYSLGITLWEIASRKIPYAGKIPMVIIGMAMAGTRETLDPHWPLVFRTLIQACWDAEPSKRPTAEKVGDEFKAAVESLEAAPRPVSKSAAELEVEQLREQLHQTQLKQKEVEKKAEEHARQLQEEKLKQQQSLQMSAPQSPEPVIPVPAADGELQQVSSSTAQSSEPVIPAKAGIHPPTHSSVGVNGENQSQVPVKTPPQAVDARMDPRLRGDDTPKVPVSQNSQSLMPVPIPVVDAKALGQLLKLVAEGEQDQAEEMIRQNKQLLQASGQVTDLSGRTFQNITAFQYALWAMDWHMWTMIKKYLPKEAQMPQLDVLEAKGTEHGKHYDIKPLTDALQTYVDKFNGWDWNQRESHWWNVVGGAQKMVPAHVVNEYARPDRPFEPCPSEWESKLPRTREMEVLDGSQWFKGSWFIAPSSEESLGSTFAFSRHCNTENGRIDVGPDAGYGYADLKALQSLWKARTQQLAALGSELQSVAAISQSPQLPPISISQNPQSLMPTPIPLVDAKALEKLLLLVAEGEQDQVEAMLQQNKQLLLVSGQVTDLSGRTFQNITAFQYALWAMDWHMWTIIKKYLPKEAQTEQLQALETKGTEHGKHYDIKPLTDALQTYADNAETIWKLDQRAIDHWNKVVGGAQKLVPAHVVNEYARLDRPFEPCPTEWESKLPRTREIDSVWDGSKYVKGTWFVAPSSQSSLGSTFAFYRYNCKSSFGRGQGPRRGWGVGEADLKALQSLWKARTQQLEALKSELLSAAPAQGMQSFGFNNG